MSGSDDVWIDMLEAVRKTVINYGRIEFEALTRKVVHRLRRFPASGIYGGGRRHKTLWDEYCHEVEHGPHVMLERAWDQTLGPLLNDVIDRIPAHAAMLLSVYVAWELDRDENPALVGAICREDMREVLMRSLYRTVAWG